jgi:Asp-tRNA(Asn)/Glu-tRNA(Gln) amidotransferase A subunit family amidase
VGPYLKQASGEGQAHFNVVCQHLARDGYQIKPIPAMPDFDAIAVRHYQMVDAEAAQVHAEWFAAYSERYEPQTAEMIRRGQAITPFALNQARAARKRLRAELTALMDAYDLDLWISPSAPGPAPEGLGNTGDGTMNAPWTQSGLPALTLPVGQSLAGLPLGLQLAARWHVDEDLLAWSSGLEQSLSDFC